MVGLYYPHNEVIERIEGLSAQDKGFLSDVMTRFPRVKQGFKTFINTEPMSRVRLAARINNEQPRTGWKRFNTKQDTISVLDNKNDSAFILMKGDVSNIETVARHSMEAAELFPIIFTGNSYRGFGMEVMKFHDFCEAIVGDFTPHDKITKAEKVKLEEIALNVLTESRKSGDLLALHIYNCMNVYEGNVKDFSAISMHMLKEIENQELNGKITPAQQPTVRYFKQLYSKNIDDVPKLQTMCKDVDVVHMLIRGTRMIKENHSSLSQSEAFEKMEEFWNYVDAKVQNTEARDFYEELRMIYIHEPEMGYRETILCAAQMKDLRQNCRNGFRESMKDYIYQFSSRSPRFG